MASIADVVAFLMTPSLPVIILGVLTILGAPILLHLILSSSSTYTVPPSVLLLGPSNAGKTSLVTLLERGTEPAPTHTSQVAQAVELSASTDSDSKLSFRDRDDATGTHTKFLMVDTPGHGKLRAQAMEKLARAEKLRAVVFVLDAAAVGEHEGLAPAANYLYDVLLWLQKSDAASNNNKRKKVGGVPVLIAANKQDLFTALPASLVKTNLEAELTRIRASRSKGLLHSGVGVDDVDNAEEQDDWLGEYGSKKFTFSQMHEFNVDVDVVGGSVAADDPGADKWWWWIAQRV